ncbi:hypothetical protein Mlab_0805 [Methanocorpusculum labreanum Z]|uniref:Uncharacterized protein n=1 Tax=Methanocorpusculum labreanum (strain ATCC 43576 / DSM 4855 / Z) TaxID=410358 RepID=A2SRM0_METLZ|nr:hypothetical protein [Methanocorpusculum labreanum]ABN06976.1 hypothetical protein Mlab_0805 [Methanocorpusculum labreanum Z]
MKKTLDIWLKQDIQLDKMYGGFGSYIYVFRQMNILHMVIELTRTVRFFELDFIHAEHPHCSLPEKSVQKILLEKNIIDFGNAERRVITPCKDYLSDVEGISCWSVSRIRQHDIPRISDMLAHNSKEIPLGEDEGICDTAHFMMFLDGAVIGVESCQQAGSISTALTISISTWCREHPEAGLQGVNINPIKRSRIDLDKLQKIRKIHLRTSPNISENYNPNVKELGRLFAMNDDSGIEITLREDKKEKKGIQGAIEWVKAQFADDNAVEKLSLLKIEAVVQNGSGKYEEIDLLDSFLIAKKRVIKLDSKTKGVSSQSMYEQINNTYEDFKTEILARKPYYVLSEIR